MLARHAGQVVLVAGTIPGERVTARVGRVGKGVLFADVEEVLGASPDRRSGAVDGSCGGNVYSHIAYPRQCILKGQIIQDAFARIGHLPLPATPDVLGSPETGYRMRARLHVQGDRVGFFREGTHDLCDPAATGQLLPETIDWIQLCSAELRRVQTHGGPDLHRPMVASLEIAENVPGDQRAVHLELQEGGDPAMYRALADGLVGLSAQASGAREPTVLAGTASIADELDVRGEGGSPLTLRRDVRAFFQGNRYLLQPLIQRVIELAGTGPVVDLYAGVGLFGLSLAVAGASNVTLVEGDLVSSADLARNAEPFSDRVDVRRQSVESFLSAGPLRRICATFIVDPPRTGMTRDALAGIINHEPLRIVYVSCDVATLARDARILVNAGWELGELTGIDLFPNTAHVEAVALFTRSA
jgi:23S rRNA (uracil1939-C5)-methyltransferase